MKRLLLIVFALFLASCSPEKFIDENNHIHSLAFDPTEPGVMYIATHYYLEKMNLETGAKEQIGEYGQDYMGFVIASDGTFYSSGHSLDVPNVGIRKSTDKGKTWTTLAYEEVDFHDITVSYANPKMIYAWSTPPEPFLTVSRNGGESWEKVVPQGLPGEIISLAANHRNNTIVYAGTLYGLFVSEDEGKNWKKEESVGTVPVISIAAYPISEHELTIATPEVVMRSLKERTIWKNLEFQQKEEIMVFLIVYPTLIGPHGVYGVTKHGKIYHHEERYGGQDWNEILR